MQQSIISSISWIWKKLGGLTRATLTNASLKLSLRPTFKNHYFESKDELQGTMSQFEFHYWKQRKFT